jgi:hypothetical protein
MKQTFAIIIFDSKYAAQFICVRSGLSFSKGDSIAHVKPNVSVVHEACFVLP